MIVGEALPAVSLRTRAGPAFETASLVGTPCVLFLYPRADTPGCTQEALDFTGLREDFASLGVRVIGVSNDPPAKLDQFAERRGLSVELVSDEDGALIKPLGAWVEKRLYGRSSMGVERSTFLIDAKGIIRRIWRKVRVAGHAQEVLEACRAGELE